MQYLYIPDQRVKDWFLMSSPLPTLLICLTYAYGVKVVGPKLMENRKPFNLRNTIIFYNLFQVIFSCWLFYEVINHFFYSIMNVLNSKKKCYRVEYADG